MKKRVCFISLVLFFVLVYIPAAGREKPERQLIEAICDAMGIETKLMNKKTGTSIDEVYIGLPAVKEFSFAADPDVMAQSCLKKIIYPIKKYEGKITKAEFIEKSIAEVGENPAYIYSKITASGDVFIVYKEKVQKKVGWSVNVEGKRLDHVKKIHGIFEDSKGNPCWLIDDKSKKTPGAKYYLLKDQEGNYSLRNLHFPKNKKLPAVIFAPGKKELAYMKVESRDLSVGKVPTSSSAVTYLTKKVLKDFFIGRHDISGAGEDAGSYRLQAEGKLRIIDYTYSQDGDWLAAIVLDTVDKNKKKIYRVSVNGKYQYASDKELSNIQILQTRFGKRWLCLSGKKKILVNGLVFPDNTSPLFRAAVLGSSRLGCSDDSGEPLFVVVQQKKEKLTYAIFSGRDRLADLCFTPGNRLNRLEEQGIDIENLFEDVFFDISKNFIAVIRNAAIANVPEDFSPGEKPAAGSRKKGSNAVNSPGIFFKLGYITYYADLFFKDKQEEKRILVSIPSYVKPRIFRSGSGNNYGLLFSFAGPGIKSNRSGDLKKTRKAIVEKKPPVYQVIINDKFIPYAARAENPKIVFSDKGNHFAFIGKNPDGRQFIITDRYISRDFHEILDIRIVGDSIIGIGVKKRGQDKKSGYRVVKIRQKL